MTDTRIRIKSSRSGYRRGGLSFSKDWQEVDTASLSRVQQRAVLDDPVLAIEGHNDDDTWSPLPAEIREGLAALLEGDALEESTPTGVGEGEPLAALDPELLASADLGRDLLATIDLHREMLETRGLWPVAVPQALFLDFAGRLGTAEDEVERLTAELAAAQTIPASDGPDGGGADTAAPAEAPPAEEPKPEATAGGDAAKPASKPKPAAGKKPAPSKAG